MPTQHALLTLAGKDRPGIVAAISRILYETGCNIEDSSMTRLRGQFTMMLMLRPPTQVRCAELEERLSATAREMELAYTVRDLPSEEEGVSGREGAAQGEEGGGVECVINVLGADRPGIVYQVTRILQEEGGNITDLQTQVGGAAHRPVYAMVIEAEVESEARLTALRRRLDEAGRELKVEVSVRRADTLML